jgi:hypothetical protein
MARRKFLGQIDLLGLNSFGQNPGMNPIIGTAIGGGIAGVTTIVARRAGSGKAELVGLGAGLAASAAMYAMKSTRHAALGAVLGAFLASGLAFVEKVAFGPLAGLGIPQMRALGIPQMRALNGLGLPAASNVSHPHGTIPGVAGSQLAAPGGGAPPVSLMGQPLQAAMHLLGVGGPAVHGLASAYGATLLGGGR